MTSNDNYIDEMELARLGIRRAEGRASECGKSAYGNVRDAIAAAKRGEKK
jgi:hypothetical protein